MNPSLSLDHFLESTSGRLPQLAAEHADLPEGVFHVGPLVQEIMEEVRLATDLFTSDTPRGHGGPLPVREVVKELLGKLPNRAQSRRIVKELRNNG
ncbi:MAG: hypothetical protein AB7J40_01410 [Candidatus Altimarinota bacterium]